MRPSAHSVSGKSAPSPFNSAMRRYPHPISVSQQPPAVVSREGIEWIYAALYAQSLVLEEIRTLLQNQSGNKI